MITALVGLIVFMVLLSATAEGVIGEGCLSVLSALFAFVVVATLFTFCIL